MYTREVDIALHITNYNNNNKAQCNVKIICTTSIHRHKIYLWYLCICTLMHYSVWALYWRDSFTCIILFYIVCIVFAILIPGHAIVLGPILLLLYCTGIALRQNAECFYWKIVFRRNVTFIPTYNIYNILYYYYLRWSNYHAHIILTTHIIFTHARPALCVYTINLFS